MVSTKRKTGAHESPASTSPNSSNPNLQNTTSHNPARTASQKRASQRAAEAQTAPLKDRRSLTSSLASSLTSGTSSTSNFEDEDDVYRENGFKIGFAEDKNKKYRRTMEDAHAFYYGFQNTPGNGWFAIFDGHAGKAAAEWCGDHLHENFETILMDNPNIPVLEALNKAFLMTDLQLSERKASYSGCTAVVGYVRTEDRHGPKRVLYTANVGDARAVLCRNGKAIRLSYDHKGSDSFEAKRIVESGGFMMNNRVNGVLAVTRSLGDITMKEWIIGSPYSTETVLDENDTCLILACDGIWDVCLDQTAVDLVKKTADPQQASEDLLDHALENFSTDNLSVLTVKFDETFMRRRNAEL
ncbi:phosphatase 2C-like domain-containing protein [Phlyctochytrium arcticum]|nr:phosphatase 2C-like domain-containing protein [Phlyctochytrium arcticum]